MSPAKESPRVKISRRISGETQRQYDTQSAWGSLCCRNEPSVTMVAPTNDQGPSSTSGVAAVVDPIEMIARLRRHAASVANTGKANDNNSTPNNDQAETGIYTDDELRAFVSMYVKGDIPEYQMSAWLMAVCFCPLGPRETATLTRCYAESGRLLEWPDVVVSQGHGGGTCRRRRPPLVDKHSSGGVGDKISLVLAPLVATCGVCVPMMAGRGLGHTGGTIDKLETSFPGYTASPETVEIFQGVVLGSGGEGDDRGDGAARPGAGCAIVEAGPELCPADRRIYALRDVTSTVSCLPLQTASIMSKKIAERPDSLVLDVKYGDGAFQEGVEDARLLAESMVSVGEANGLVPTTAFLTDMNHPIGRAVGNWVETHECIDVLKGNFRGNKNLRLSQDLIALVVVQAGQMLHQSCRYRTGQRGGTIRDGSELTEEEQAHHKYETMSLDDCILHAYKVLDSGLALHKFRDMLLAQGADPLNLNRALETPESIPLASFVAEWKYQDEDSSEDNSIITYIADIPARTIGDVAVDLGAGRKKAGEEVDGQAGLVFRKKPGDAVSHGDVIVTLYTNRSQTVADAALQRVRDVVALDKRGVDDPDPFASKRIVTHIVSKEAGTEPFVMPGFLLGEEASSA